MIVSLRHSHEFNDYNLEKLYGVLKTYELEIQQDEEIEKGQRKDKSVALVAKNKEVRKKKPVWWLFLKHQEGMLVKANWKLEKEKAKLK